MKKSAALLIFCLLIGLMGCNAGAETAVSQLPTATPVMMDTAVPPTLTPTATPLPATPTPIPPTQTPTVTATPSPTATPNFSCPQPGGNATLQKSIGFVEFSDNLLVYLNAGGNIEQLPELLDSMDISNEVFPVDMNNDTVLEIVLNVAVPEEPYFYEYGTSVLQCLNGSYEAIFAIWWGYYHYFDYTFSDDVDNDGNQDVIIVGGFAGSACDLEPSVLIWSDGKIINASPDHLELKLGCYGNDQVITSDLDGDSTKELIVSGWTVGHIDHGPLRTITQTFSLQNKTYRLEVTEFGPPEYLVHLLDDAQRALDRGNWTVAAQLYEEIAQNQSLPTVPSYVFPYPQQVEELEEALYRAKGYQQAFALFRLAALQTVHGNLAEADWAVAQLQERFPEGTPGSEFNSLTLLLVDSLDQGRTPQFSCEIVAREIVKSYPELVFHYYWGTDLASYQEETICPFATP